MPLDIKYSRKPIKLAYNHHMLLKSIPARHLSFLLLCTGFSLAGCAIAEDVGMADSAPIVAREPRLAEAPARIALLLPASGPLAKSADAVRNGFFAAYFYRLNKTYQPVIQIYDTGTHTDTMLTAYRQAVAEAQLAPVDEPDLQDVKLEEGAPLSFVAVVEVRPEIALGEYKAVEVQHVTPAVVSTVTTAPVLSRSDRATSAARHRSPFPDSSDRLPSAFHSFIVAAPSPWRL